MVKKINRGQLVTEVVFTCQPCYNLKILYTNVKAVCEY